MSFPNPKSAHFKDDITAVPPVWKIKLLYDGLCPLCLREVNFLMRKDAGRSIVAFVDIADLSYAPEDHGNVDFAEAMGRIHAILPDGTIIRDVEVFRRVYEALGMGWIYAPTRWPIVQSVVDVIYRGWASWRLALTGRPQLAALLAERQSRLNEVEAGRCRFPQSDRNQSCNLP